MWLCGTRNDEWYKWRGDQDFKENTEASGFTLEIVTAQCCLWSSSPGTTVSDISIISPFVLWILKCKAL